MSIALRAGVGGTIRAGTTELHGLEVVLVRSDPSTKRGALDLRSSETIAHAARAALKYRRPLVLVLNSSGADVHEGVAGLHGWGLAAKAITQCSGVVPVVAAVTGPILSGPSLLLGLTDVAVVTERATAYVVGPGAVAAITGQQLSAEDLGGAQVHAKHTGVAAAVLPDEDTALEWLATLLDFLPPDTDQMADRVLTGDPGDRLTPEAGELLPATAAGSYDVRKVAEAVADDGFVHEIWAQWSPHMVTAFCRIDGHSVGIVANQPLSMAGTIDIVASQKAARFVDLCDAMNVPILTLIDTPGFFPGKTLEWRGMIRHGAQLVAAYARATVPRICIVLRKAYGGAYIVMDSKRMGNDVALAWPSAELAVMGAKQAIEILHRTADEATRAAAQADYEETLLTPWVAAERGYVDAVIDPSETRREVAAALEILLAKREALAPRSHDTGPL
ncbi:MAG TPA: carboxyl transferase domain-containing protein [Acidimicrobiales bacterium]|nr:carboxyl transferase domain-containing protein [Acidimicrobiales bacterium]